MKKSIIFLISINCILFISSCSKTKLDVAPDSSLSSGTFWRNENDATLACTGVYSTWLNSGDTYAYNIQLSDDWSDDAIPTGFWRFFRYYAWGIGNISATNVDLNSFWSDLYVRIRTANVFLDNVGRCQMDNALRDRYIGEVKFIRAFQYFLLNEHWGEVPLITTPIEDAVTLKNTGRAANGQTVAFIINDLDDAISKLPVSTVPGRVGKGAAIALKARVQLYAGDYANAAATAKSLMDINAYSLHRPVGKNGYQDLCNTVHNDNSEAILGWQYDAVNNSNGFPGLVSSLDLGLVSPTDALVASYDCYDPATFQLIPVDNSTAISRFLNRDPRLNYTIAHTGSTSPFNGAILNSEAAPLTSNSTGYACVKFAGTQLVNGAANNSTDYTLIRYAEVLLTYAEAKIEAGQVDQSVLDAINDVRSRAYGVNKSDVSQYPTVTTTSQTALREIIRKERRVELAFEGLRWFDVKRWKVAAGAGGTMNGSVAGAVKEDMTQLVAGTRTLSDKDYLRPVPQAQIDLTNAGVLAQNPGY